MGHAGYLLALKLRAINSKNGDVRKIHNELPHSTDISSDVAKSVPQKCLLHKYVMCSFLAKWLHGWPIFLPMPEHHIKKL
jgi:hypothetical protein